VGGIVKKFANKVALAVSLVLAGSAAFSSAAFAQYGYYDDDDYYERGGGQQAHQYGYQNGYHDGYRKGQHEGRENDPGDINVRALQEATHGYKRWMGPIDAFQDGYRDGYRRGFRMGYQSTNRGWRDRDYEDRYGY
jgi:flagellar biosynthesis/type III secretory pathway protein FliH